MGATLPPEKWWNSVCVIFVTKVCLFICYIYIYFSKEYEMLWFLMSMVRNGHNPYLFFAKQKSYVCDVVMFIFAWSYVLSGYYRPLDKKRLVYHRSDFWCVFVIDENGNISGIVLLCTKMCYVWDSVIYMITWIKCLAGFFHSATCPAVVFHLLVLCFCAQKCVMFETMLYI